MNNDNNASSPSVVCSLTKATTAATGNGTAAAGGGAVGGPMNANDTNSSSSTIGNQSATTTPSTASPSIHTSAGAAKSAAVPTTGPNDDNTNKSESWEESRLKDWDYCRFKELLEEAYSYKNPRDKENKSEIFLQLLQKAEKEKEDQKFAFRALTSLYTPRTSTSNSQKQGGSLQDLVEAVRNDSLDSDYNYGGPRNRRHNHNSRPKKYSSVSSRQREGGSLPSNVNVSNCSLSVYEQPFLNEKQQPKHQHQHQLQQQPQLQPAPRHIKPEPRVLSNNPNTAACQGAVGGVSAVNASSITSSIGPTPSIHLRGGGEIILSTAACTAPNKNEFSVVGGCGRVLSEGGSSINTASLAATIANSTSATCAALATATAVVSDSRDTIVEMNDNYMDQHNDMMTQGIPYDRFDGIEMKIPRANIIGSVLTRSDFSPNNNTCYVDEAVHFTTLERGKSSVDASYIPLDESYKACKSVMGEKSDLVKMQSFSGTKPISKQYDENGNSLNTTFTTSQSQAKAKKKKPQSERNTKTLDVQSVEGYRGSDPIEELVKYIESSEDTKQNEKVSKFADNNNKKKEKKRDKEKEKDKDKEKEKEKGKIKRSNSLEELRSCSKLDGDDVTMRNKSNIKKQNVEVKEKQQIVPVTGNTGTNRKGERRSWGTEELTYLGENNAIEEVREKVKDKEKKKSKEKDFSEKLEKVVEKRKKSEPNLVVSMESISCESAEFHVVTKKKKPKKQRQLTEDGRNNISSNSQKNPMYQNRKYHSNFSNDRDAYMGSFNNNSSNEKSRRKSTSSMPPSEKSDSSDLDSVHSLPIESAGGRSPLQAHHHQNQPRSYAEIARKTETAGGVIINTTGGAIDSTASNTSSNNSSHTELEMNTANSVPAIVNLTTTKKSKKSIKTDFPELISNDIVSTSSTSSTTPSLKQISYSQSLISTAKNEEVVIENTTQKLSPPIEFIKTTEKQIMQQQPQQQSSHQPQQQHQMPLQKSKSVETDSFYNSIDQYPALEKTVKRHSTANACGSEVGGSMPITPPAGLVSLQVNSITSCSTIIGNSTPASKKSKTNTKANEEIFEQQLQQHPTAKKSKKEKSIEHVSITQSTTTPSSTTSSTCSSSASNINNKNQINYNHHNYNLNNTNNNNKSSCSNSHNNNNNNSSSNVSSNNKFSNRPAVIILNDDTTAGGLSSCIGNEFTFGDFNEDELRLFDDSQPSQPNTEVFPKRYSAVTMLSTKTATTTQQQQHQQNFDDSGGNFNTTGGSDVTNNSDDALLLMQHTSSPNSSLVTDQSSDSGICNIYDTVKGKKVNNLQSSATSKLANRSSSTDTLINNVINSSASTSPSKESLSSASSSSSSSSSNSSTSSSNNANVPVTKSSTSAAGKMSKSITTSLSSPNYNQQPQSLDSSKNKTHPNNSLCNTKVSTMNKRNSQRQHQQQQQPQQNQSSSSTNSNCHTAKTCDDIETAIIAAAKKAAAVAAEQISTSVINKNHTTKGSSNLSSMGSNTSSSTTSNNINNNNNSNVNHLNSYSSQQGKHMPQSSVAAATFCQSKDFSRRGGASNFGTGVQGQQQRKEIDVHFIPPTLATPISSIQNNETIINFIGSAWEEVANSKVTQFYDGQ